MQFKIYTSLIASTDLWPQEMFTFLEMLATIVSERSFGDFVCRRRPAGPTRPAALVDNGLSCLCRPHTHTHMHTHTHTRACTHTQPSDWVPWCDHRNRYITKPHWQTRDCSCCASSVQRNNSFLSFLASFCGTCLLCTNLIFFPQIYISFASYIGFPVIGPS